jgi:Yip1 domain
MEAQTAHRTSEKDWWLRSIGVLITPRSTFLALRDESDEALNARQEVVLALAFLAGIGGVLASPWSATLMDDPARDAVTVAVLVFIAGGLYGAATYWVGGSALALGIHSAGGAGKTRGARHLLAFAAAPLALALVLWPIRLAVYGDHVFHSGGRDSISDGRYVFYAADIAFSVWAMGLLILGVMTVHAWPLIRSLGAIVLTILALVALGVVFALAL